MTDIQTTDTIDALVNKVKLLPLDVAADFMRQLSVAYEQDKTYFARLSILMREAGDSLQWSYNVRHPIKYMKKPFRCGNHESDIALLRQLPYGKPKGYCNQQCEECRIAQQSIKNGQEQSVFD